MGFGFLFFLSSFFFFYRLAAGSDSAPFREEQPTRWGRLGFLTLAAALLLFFGFYRLSLEPPGIFIDTGALGMDALRLLHWHQIPSLHLKIVYSPPLVVYGLAGWLILFPASVYSLHVFFLIISWLALWMFYLWVQELGGERLALTALMILAANRWYFTSARNAFLHIIAPLIAFAVLYFFWRAIRTGKLTHYALGGLFLGAGFYTYQALKVLPLLVAILAFYEIAAQNQKPRWAGLRLMGGLSLILAAPVVLSWIQEGSLGVRESQLWIGHSIAGQKSLSPLLKNLFDFSLMFNHLEAPYPCMGIKGHRLLDDVTSFLFLIGLFQALRHWRERLYFYLLAGFIVMSLPLLLASDYLAYERIVGVAPFVAAFAALPVVMILQGAKERLGRFRGLIWVPVILAFALCVFQNYDVYFNQQANDPASWRSFGSEATRVGEAVVSHPGVTYLLDPCFWEHETVRFLCFDQAARVHPLVLEDILRPVKPLQGKLCFVLDDGKKPTLELLERVYPGGREEDLKDPWGGLMAYYYYWEPGPKRFLPMEKEGFVGRYFNSAYPSGAPDAIRWDPLLNFTKLSDFPISGPLFYAQWKGNLNVPKKGKYRFFILSTDQGKLLIDGRQALDTLSSNQESIELSKGVHRIELSDERARPGEIRADFHLLWIPPGQTEFSVVPAAALGRVLTD